MQLPPLPPRPIDGHKGTFGSVCIIGGQRSEDGLVMIGAPALAGNSAMRSGCGKTMLAMPQQVLQAGLELAPTATGIELPVDEVGRLIPSSAIEAIDKHASACRCLVIGPGFGCDWPQQQIIATLLSREDRPIVLDADGLNALAALPSGQLELRAPTIMTPHIGEYKRLAKIAGIESESAEELAQAFGCVVVLKSNTTEVSDGVRSVVKEEGGVELATGGTGDVLSGIIAGTLVQFGIDCVSHLFEAAILGVHIHGMAGRDFARQHGASGMIATDLLARVPDAISAIRDNGA
ncbi:MAG: NAD(P)H-hydrate dehydratase [Phycisphaerae bacterium]|nr:NAD(P)H-hydrate dehydratase [Phycisphaerae bacterium]